MKKTIPILLMCLIGLLSACGGNKASPAKEFAPREFYDFLAETYDLSAMMTLDPDAVYNYLGVAPEDYSQGVAALQTNSVLVDEIWVFQAVDEAAAERILRAAELRLEIRSRETKDYFPDQYVILERGKCVRKGTAVALFVSPDSEEMAELFSRAAG